MSQAEQILNFLAEGLQSAAPLIRNAPLPETIPPQGLLILRDGTPTLEEPPLGGIGDCYYRHEIALEIYVQQAETAARDRQFDALLQEIGDILNTDPTLHGLVFGLQYSRPSVEVEAVEGAPAIKQAVLTLTVEYATALPLS